jgi:hypothetical protein
MNRLYILALAFVLFAAYWTRTHPPERWDFIGGTLTVPDDELLELNPE